MKVVFCQATYKDDFELTKECIARVSPHVDATIIVYDQTLTKNQISWLQQNEFITEGIVIYSVFHEFKDDLPAMRNAYLSKAKHIDADWCVVSDPDELYSEELALNLRSVIEQHNALGYNLLPVHARDQFENVEMLDDLDILKESPGGYRETEFWKPLLIFKVHPDIRYEGVGIEKNVHEMLKTGVDWVPKNLPRELFYVHKKSALRIWRNAARNMFISGGGDNVGRVNPHWEPLRLICARHKVYNWIDFEKFIEEGRAKEDTEWDEWLLNALQAPPINWGTETRETAKWFYALHPDLVSDRIREIIENPPQMTPEIEAENLVTRTYFELLGRHPDKAGKEFYTDQILKAGWTQEKITQSLMNSDEFQRLSGRSTPHLEQVKVQVPVNVSVNIDENIFAEALRRSDTYWEKFKPKYDLGSHILGTLKDGLKNRFMRWFYRTKIEDVLTPQEIAHWIIDNFPRSDSLALCIMGYSNVLPMILESISIMASHVDEIHVTGDDWTSDDMEKMKTAVKDAFPRGKKKSKIVLPDIEIHTEPWFDDFSDYKNKAIAPANTEWVLVLDHDEIPTEDMAKNISDVISHSKAGKTYDMVTFDVIDQAIVDGEVVSENKSSQGKGLLHWNVESPYYGNPHIWLKPNYHPWKTARAPLAYRHVKEKGTELPRSVRNVFLGGGGDNTREGNPLWVKLRVITRTLGIDTWARFHEYLKAGDIDDDIMDILSKLAEMPWKDSELGDPLRYYQNLQKKLNKREGK